VASFSTSIGSLDAYTGGGSCYPAGFGASHTPEAGSVGFGVGTANLTMHARVTDLARQYLARSVTDGTAFIIDEFAVGVGGYDVANPLSAIDVDPAADSLISEIYRGEVGLVEDPTSTGTSKSFLCRVGPQVKAGIGEFGLIARILHSPFISEVGQTFLFAAAHQPLQGKTNQHVLSLRLVLAM